LPAQLCFEFAKNQLNDVFFIPFIPAIMITNLKQEKVKEDMAKTCNNFLGGIFNHFLLFSFFLFEPRFS
jgi:hypothetical protein